MPTFLPANVGNVAAKKCTVKVFLWVFWIAYTSHLCLHDKLN